MSRDVDEPRPSVGRQRATAVGLVIVAAVSPQLGAPFAVSLFDELGPAGAAFVRLAGISHRSASAEPVVQPRRGDPGT